MESNERLLKDNMDEYSDNLVMRRTVKEVKGHRVVVMEVGPSEMSDTDVGDGDNASMPGESIIEEDDSHESQ